MTCDTVCAFGRKPVTPRRGVSALCRPLPPVLSIKREVEFTREARRCDRVTFCKQSKTAVWEGEHPKLKLRPVTYRSSFL